jgi:hypothetical protein
MTENFDAYCESLINELFTSQNKRKEHKSRYWGPNQYSKAQPRQVRTMNTKTASQRTKLGNQQYIGNIWKAEGPRGQNKSQKTPQEIAIAKGHGSHIRIDGVNPKQVGSSVNSKQGDMEVKYHLDNGVTKVGKSNKKDYFQGGVERRHMKRALNN